MISLPSTIKKTIYVFVDTRNFYTKDADRIHVYTFDASKSDAHFVLLCTKDIDVEIPSVDINTLLIENLKISRQKIIDEADLKVRHVDEKISSLLCIEHHQI